MLTEQERLFLRMLDDLEKRVEHHDPYEILLGSGLIRKLLLDSYPLVDQVNRRYRERIIFEVGEPFPWRKIGPIPVLVTLQDGIDPDALRPGGPRQYLNRDEFLNFPIATVGGRDYSLREIVLFEAHIMGGVHSGVPKEDIDKVLHTINATFQVGGYRATLRQLKGIGRVILKALSPLRSAIQNREGTY
jgi:hypothetical protein